MIINLNNQLKYYENKTAWGRSLERKIMELHREGWFPVNIASIARIDMQTVREVLTRNKVILDGKGNPVMK